MPFDSIFSTDEDRKVGDDGRSQFGEVEGKALAIPPTICTGFLPQIEQVILHSALHV